jgi:hypothetical protein
MHGPGLSIHCWIGVIYIHTHEISLLLHFNFSARLTNCCSRAWIYTYKFLFIRYIYVFALVVFKNSKDVTLLRFMKWDHMSRLRFFQKPAWDLRFIALSIRGITPRPITMPKQEEGQATHHTTGDTRYPHTHASLLSISLQDPPTYVYKIHTNTPLIQQQT